MSATILPFRRPASRQNPPLAPLTAGALAAPALMAGILAFSFYAAFTLASAQAAASALNGWRR